MMQNEKDFPTPGTVLWAVDVDLAQDVFRSGAATKPNVEYLRFIDLNIDDQDGRIPEDQADKFTVNPGQGISLFLERMIPEGLVLMDAATWKNIDKKKQKKLTGGESIRITQFQAACPFYTTVSRQGIAR